MNPPVRKTHNPTANLPRSVENLRSHVLHCATEREAQLLIRALFDAAKVCELDVTVPEREILMSPRQS